MSTPDTPTGAARTADPPSSEAVETILRGWGWPEAIPLAELGDLLRMRAAQHAATLSHLAGQAGPEVRALVEAYRDALDEVMAHGFDSPDIMLPKDRERQREAFRAKRERLAAAETALLAAYEALRQQRDEAVGIAQAMYKQELDKAIAEAASERQRAERLARVLRDARENEQLQNADPVLCCEIDNVLEGPNDDAD